MIARGALSPASAFPLFHSRRCARLLVNFCSQGDSLTDRVGKKQAEQVSNYWAAATFPRLFGKRTVSQNLNIESGGTIVQLLAWLARAGQIG